MKMLPLRERLAFSTNTQHFKRFVNNPINSNMFHANKSDLGY